ncbi:MAG: DeoR/GlpR transcriptional regulator, partial [Deltaproteobacteria bacterium]|nr:DeoR/GlpR transcriptional regulator [Deltaproteobacteria bacterium]
GPTALSAVRTINIDKAFVGVHGIDPARGLTANNGEDAAVNQAMMDQAHKTIALADHSKFGKVAKFLICPASRIDLLITDTGANTATTAPFRDMGIEVRRV